MRKMISTLSLLPGIAFAHLPTTGETIAIRSGAPVYYRVATNKSADELNAMYGVDKAQVRAMLAGVMLGWDTPLANPENYNADGELRYDVETHDTNAPPDLNLEKSA
jgi:hypothetical protein